MSTVTEHRILLAVIVGMGMTIDGTALVQAGSGVRFSAHGTTAWIADAPYAGEGEFFEQGTCGNLPTKACRRCWRGIRFWRLRRPSLR